MGPVTLPSWCKWARGGKTPHELADDDTTECLIAAFGKSVDDNGEEIKVFDAGTGVEVMVPCKNLFSWQAAKDECFSLRLRRVPAWTDVMRFQPDFSKIIWHRLEGRDAHKPT